MIPNIIDPSVPIGPDDSCNVEVERFGEPVVPDFEIPHHVDIMATFDGIDKEAAGRVAGMGFYYLLGDIARLHEINPFLSNTDLVYTILRDQIVNHKLQPGKKLNQEQIAIDMNVSRTPVREAFFRLETEGFLEKGAQGYTVYEMTPGDYMMLLDVRIAIERLATRLACSQMLGSERRQLEQNLSETQRVLDSGIGKAWNGDFDILNQALADRLFYEMGQLDHAFHRMIIAASHNKYLVSTYDSIDPKIHFFRYSALSVSACLNMTERHKKVFEAIVARDEELAERRMERHLALTVPRAMGL